jgi:uncharacterized protein YkwD
VAQGGYQSEVLSKVNVLRQARGLPTLQYSQSMDAAAARHSYDQSGKRSMTHAGELVHNCLPLKRTNDVTFTPNRRFFAAVACL